MKDYVVTEYGVVPGKTELQTKEIQAVLDLCKEGGGRVIFPRGKYNISSLWMWSDTTLYLQKGAEIYGSTECDDYEVFPISDEIEMRSDM